MLHVPPVQHVGNRSSWHKSLHPQNSYVHADARSCSCATGPLGATEMATRSSVPLLSLPPSSRDPRDDLHRHSAPSIFRGAWRRRVSSASAAFSLAGDALVKGATGLTLLHEPSEPRVDFIFVRHPTPPRSLETVRANTCRRSMASTGAPERLGALSQRILQPTGPSNGFPTSLASSMCASTPLATTRTGPALSTAL